MIPPDTSKALSLAHSLFSALQTEISPEKGQSISETQMEEIERCLQDNLSLVKMSMNGRRMVNLLPGRVLVHIFSFLQDFECDEPFSKPSLRSASLRPKSWLAITHVCRHWRSLAHQAPSIWNRIHILSNTQHLPTFLYKSGNSPLIVLCGTLPIIGSTGKDQRPRIPQSASLVRALYLLCTNADRIAELHFYSDFPVDSIVQRDDFMRMVAPIISSKDPSEGDRTAAPGDNVFQKLFSALSTQVQKLFLHGASVSYMMASNDRSAFNNLTHLSLFNQPRVADMGESHMDITSFLDVVQASSQSLQSLTLIRAGPVFDPSPNPEPSLPISKRTPIQLSVLSRLELGDWNSNTEIAYFLAHLIIPGSTERCIWGEGIKCISSVLFPIDPDTAQNKVRGWDLNVRRVNFTSIRGKKMIGIHDNTVFIQGNFDFLSIYPLFRDQRHIFKHVEYRSLHPQSS